MILVSPSSLTDERLIRYVAPVLAFQFFQFLLRVDAIRVWSVLHVKVMSNFLSFFLRLPLRFLPVVARCLGLLTRRLGLSKVLPDFFDWFRRVEHVEYEESHCDSAKHDCRYRDPFLNLLLGIAIGLFLATQALLWFSRAAKST
jgi:hypothetical protein